MDLVVVRGGGDLASGIVHRLYKSGFKIVVLEIEKPMCIRRTVSFSEAIYSGEVEVEGIRGKLARSIDEIWDIIEEDSVPVYVDPNGESIDILGPLAVVDAIIAKVNLGTNRGMAPITIGVGPGFEAGVDVDLVIESKRGHNLGKVIYKGSASPNTGIPSTTLGYSEERVLRAPTNGILKSNYSIGDKVNKGDIICYVGDMEVVAEIGGILRGILKEGLYATNGLKIGDIDPRGEIENAFTVSDKARAIGGGVLEAILYWQQKEGVEYVK